MAPANTGRLRMSRIAVTRIAHVYKEYWFELNNDMPNMVTTRLIAPSRLLKPLRCRLTIVLSTDKELWLVVSDKVG
jgi:hypothetical protein